MDRLLAWLGLVDAPQPPQPLSRDAQSAAPEPEPLRVAPPWEGLRPAPSADPAAVRAAVLRALFAELDALPDESPGGEEPDPVQSRRFLTRLMRMLGESQLALPVFPDVACRLDVLLRGPAPSITEVAALVRRDPDLVRRVWKGARSAHYARGASSLDAAIARMGYDELWRVGMGACLHAPVFKVGRYQRRIELLRQHGLVASQLAHWLSAGAVPEASLAALLHKGGVLMILRCLPPGPLPDPRLVERVVRHHHASVGMLMAHAWGLGASVAAGIGFHPLPGAAPVDHRDCAALVHAGSIASHSAEEGLAGRDCGGRAALLATPGLLLDPDAVLARAARAWRGRSEEAQVAPVSLADGERSSA